MEDNSKMRDELLNQNGKAAVDRELDRLRQLADAQDRRVRRLGRWTIGVWIAAGALLLVGALVLAAVPSGSTHVSAATSGPAQTAVSRTEGPGQAIITLCAMLVPLAGLLALAGIVLVIVLLFSRRSATLSQIRVSMLAVETQLKMMAQKEGAAPKP